MRKLATVMLAAATAVLCTCMTRAWAASPRSRAVEYRDGDQTFEGLLVVPRTGKAKLPAVLLIHNWLGISDETKRQAERIAKLGLAVFAVDVYGKGVRPKNADEGAALSAKYKADRKLLRDRIRRGLEVLRVQKEVDPGRVIAVGYCFGGTGALELARSGSDVLAAVTFHGGLDSVDPNEGKAIKARIVVFHGADDPYVKPADIDAFENEMRLNHVDWQMTSYGGAVHSFTEVSAGSDTKAGAAYDAKADKRSFEGLTALVNELFPKR